MILLNDHQAYYRHGWDNGPQILRPRLDSLARDGVLFERAYAQTPLCSPARKTLLTGLQAHKHGEIKNGVGAAYTMPTFLELLQQDGYDTFWFGKWHAGVGTPADFGAQGVSYPSYNNPYTKPEFADYLQRKGLPAPEVVIDRSFEDDEYGLVPGQIHRQDRAWCNEHATGVTTTPKETHEAFYLASLASDELDRRADDDRPFVMVVSFWGPHPPYFPTQEYLDLYDPSAIPPYGSFDIDLSTLPEVYLSERNVPLHDDAGRIIQPNPLSWADWQAVMAHCYAQQTLVDDAGGAILDKLSELELDDDTLVLWTADHGDAVASFGGHFDKRSFMPEEVLRIPFALRWPAVVPPAQVSRDLVGHIDVLPTLLDAAGVSLATEVDGASILPRVTAQGTVWRDMIVAETHGHLENIIGRAVIRDRFKYVWYQHDGEELYDLLLDPYEVRNLASSTEHASVLNDLRARLAQWRAENGDDASLERAQLGGLHKLTPRNETK